MTIPIVFPFFLEIDRETMTVARVVEHAVAADVCGDGDAALISDERWFRLGVPDSCAKVRAGFVQAAALTGAGCAHRSAEVGCQACCRWLLLRDTATYRPCGDWVLCIIERIAAGVGGELTK
ncbi:MAG TPA: hypothetical protein VMT53_12215 [Terriglobales bacterium]|nr:hypothetical protein [Terriglobales bacterium]